MQGYAVLKGTVTSSSLSLNVRTRRGDIAWKTDDGPCAAQVACNKSQWAAWHCSECRQGAAGPTDCLGACTSGFMFKEEFGAW